MLSPRQRQGQSWESYARCWLERQGLRLIQSNFRCTVGEIDLIMREKEVLVFVEVRYRAGRTHGGALESVTAAKQQRLSRAARHFLRLRPELRNMPLRFDVVAIVGPAQQPEVDWRPHAILPSDSGTAGW